MPGVSMSNAPPGNGTSSRCVVVWRPRESFSRTSRVSCRSWPTSRLISVDFPTPDDPSSATVVAQLQVGEQLLDPASELRADGVDGHGARNAGDLRAARLQIVGEVGLVEDDHGPRAALPRHREVPLEAPDAEVAIEAGDEKRDVHVCREDLLGRLLARDLAREQAGARQDVLDGRALLARGPSHADPVAHRRQVTARLRLVPHPPRHVGQRFVVFEVHAERRAVGHRHARRQQALAAIGLEELPLSFRPAELEDHAFMSPGCHVTGRRPRRYARLDPVTDSDQVD